MLIKNVCKECKLTKKAVEYYERQGLISPAIEDNGYRNYNDEDISKLKEIGVLRKLGISVTDIKNILASSNKTGVLARFKYKMDLEAEKAIAKKKCLELLIKNYDIEQAIGYIEENIEMNFTIKEKLLQGFPGGYGLFLCMHFGRFLDIRIDTEEKEQAYCKIVNYLDKIQNMEFDAELEEYLMLCFGQLEQKDMQRIDESVLAAVNDLDGYLEEHREDIDKYLEYRNSDEFKESAAYKMQQLLLQFQRESGYYDVFLENLKILSDSYKEYVQKLQAANEAFINKYPQAKNIYELEQHEKTEE